MPIINIIDNRSNEFNPDCDAVLEIWSNTSLPPGSKVFDGGHIQTEWIEEASVRIVLDAARHFEYNVTVFLYDRSKVREEINSLPIVHPRIKPEPMKEIPEQPGWV